jgi:hypothetical protein
MWNKNLFSKFLFCICFYITELVTNARLTSPLRTATPSFSGNGNTRPTSPASSSPLRHTIAATNIGGTNIRSREGSREREREPLDYTDLEGNYSLDMIE